MTGLNLHKIVRGAITTLHPDETVTIYRGVGQQNVRGEITPEYEIFTAQAQIQSLSDEKLFHSGLTGQNNIARTFYMHSAESTIEKPSGVIRPLSRPGDMIQRADGTWWLVTTVKEDFSASGWVNVGAEMQVKPPMGVTP